MKINVFLSYLVLVVIFASCSKDSESNEPVSKCGVPTTDNYIVGEIDSECVFVELGGAWSNSPGAIGGFDCGKVLNSDFGRNAPGLAYRIVLSIPHLDGQSCPELSPNAIKIGKYSLLKGNTFTEPGQAGFSIQTDVELLGSWAEDLDQNSDAYFEITSVEDIPKQSGWPIATYYKRVTGKINCKIKNLFLVEPPIEIKDLNFSVYMIY